jgi:hypothetical protein
MRSTEFRGIASAPRDGTLIEVRHGPDQVIVLAWWAGQNQGFVRDDDPLRRTLHRVSLWRPAKPKAGQGPVTMAELVSIVPQRIVTQAKPQAAPATGAVIVVSRRPKRR